LCWEVEAVEAHHLPLDDLAGLELDGLHVFEKNSHEVFEFAIEVLLRLLAPLQDLPLAQLLQIPIVLLDHRLEQVICVDGVLDVFGQLEKDVVVS